MYVTGGPGDGEKDNEETYDEDRKIYSDYANSLAAVEITGRKKPGQWSSQVGISGCATWSSPLTSMSQFNDYYGTNFDDDDYHGAKAWYDNQIEAARREARIQDFYAGRQEMSLGVLELMYCIVSTVQLVEVGVLGYAAVSEWGTAAAAKGAFSPKAFADDIFKFNKATDGGGVLLNGNPASAINSAMYYETAAEQGASIFRSISHGHMFMNGNKRTAVAAFQAFARQNGLKTVSLQQMMNVATKVSTGQVTDVS
ncbi:hypothetical protein Y10_16400 [Neptunitalea sp. Y10]|uniref:Fido domain-containing protein n=2 Tax=Neptunitalea lumnitzerae TaxID=2965509 RepID=A0ABQ5MK29_9FLAO|nr:hypothetical protein Y10_16400 [Neptunitalea sp. Y10]